MLDLIIIIEQKFQSVVCIPKNLSKVGKKKKKKEKQELYPQENTT